VDGHKSRTLLTAPRYVKSFFFVELGTGDVKVEELFMSLNDISDGCCNFMIRMTHVVPRVVEELE